MLLQIPQRRRRAISLTPLIDVVFILLVFFMLASSFTDWRHYDIGTGSDAGDSAELSVATVAISAAQQWSLDNQPISGPDAITTALKNQLQAKPELMVVLQPAGELSLQLTLNALDAIKSAGISKISLAAASPIGAPR